jgi:hypothetical protein
MGDSPASAIGPADDYLHPHSDSPWETETCWFSLYDVEKSLTAYLYAVVRPNLGVCAGGAIVWDDSAYLPWEIPHFDYQWHAVSSLTVGSSLVETPVGVSVEAEQPLQQYRVRYSRDDLEIDVRFDAIAEPHVPQHGDPPFAAARHFDQPGHVTGSLVRAGVESRIDCLAMRDRSWGPRDDRRPGRFGYTFGTVSPDLAFLAYSQPKVASDRIFAGYLIRDGVRARLVSGDRSVRRDGVHGGPQSVVIDAVDELGRSLKAEGRAFNALCFTPYPRMLNWTTTLTWQIDGEFGVGEDQDVWPIHRWAAARRGADGAEPLVTA